MNKLSLDVYEKSKSNFFEDAYKKSKFFFRNFALVEYENTFLEKNFCKDFCLFF